MRRSFMAQVSEGLIPRPKEFVAVLFCDVKNIVGFVAAEALDERNSSGSSQSFAAQSSR